MPRPWLVPTLLLALLPGGAPAQNPHLRLGGPRALEARLAEADVAVVVEVESIEDGRLHARRARALAGTTPERFAVKRSPLRPPPLAAGDRALLFLAGARPPYRLLGTPGEMLRIDDPTAETAYGDLVEALVAADAARTTRLSLAAIDDGPGALRELALVGLLARGADALDAEQRAARAAVALDPSRDAAAREAAARLALASADGTRRLLTGLPGLDPSAPGALEVARRALRDASAHRAPGDRAAHRDALRAVLAHPEAELREIAAEAAATLGGLDPKLARELDRRAEADPSPRVRSAAHRARLRFERPAPDSR